MRYMQHKGYEAVKAMEAEKSLQLIQSAFEALGTQGGVQAVIVCAEQTQTVDIQPGQTLEQVLESVGLPGDGKQVKMLHIGYPIGGLFAPDMLSQPLTAALLAENGLCPGSLEIHVLCEDTCMVDYLARLMMTLQEESCGRCVFCREGLRQLRRIFEDVTNGKAGADDLELIRVLAEGMRDGAHCQFGRSVGAMCLHALEAVGAELEAHIRRKRCAAMVCRKYITYHILGSKCQGCEKCLEVCPREAIEGEEDYIHVIDSFECDKCGKCVSVCPHDAIVKAGAVKPKTPDEPIPVGTWRGR